MNKGKLYLVPNTLDFGVEGAAVDLQEVLPIHVIRVAARLTHWAAENAKTTRTFLKRVDAIQPLALPLQEIRITELPRPPKGRNEAAPPQDWGRLLTPAPDGQDLGLISEAGLPAIADPGALLVEAAQAANIGVVSCSGPS